MLRNRRLGVLALGALVLVGCEDEPSEPAEVRFEQPANGDEMTGSEVRAVLAATGVEITSADVEREGTGHHHIFIDVDVTPMQDTIPAGVPGVIHMGDGRSDHVVEGLEPGEHRLIAVVADRGHVPLNPAVVDTVTFTVVAPEMEEDEETDGDGS